MCKAPEFAHELEEGTFDSRTLTTTISELRAQESTSTLLVSPSAINIMITPMDLQNARAIYGQAAVWHSKDCARKLSVCL